MHISTRSCTSRTSLVTGTNSTAGTDRHTAPLAARCWLGVTCRVVRGAVRPGWVGATRAHVVGYNVRGVARSHEQRSLFFELSRCVKVVSPWLVPRAKMG